MTVTRTSSCFNTTLVQLKGAMRSSTPHWHAGFNTTLVQLKVAFSTVKTAVKRVSIPHWFN